MDRYRITERKKVHFVKSPAIFYGAIVVAIIALILGVEYLIPGVPHLLTDTAMHLKHAVLFFFIAAICIVGALVTRPKANRI